jgi:sterol desaturase/sphingolipid hydroxylase (fatty acid hydroxylase superfamily)
MKNKFNGIITYGLYPFLLAVVLLVILGAVNHHWNYSTTYGLTTLGLVLMLILVETIFPLREKWKMTGKSFWRDFKYILVDAPLIALVKSAFGLLAIYYSEHHKGIFSDEPVIWSTIGFLLVFEFLQYWYHRLSHTGKGPVGRFLWKVHLAHHLPDRVYIVMHAVFNPVNAFITAAIIQAPLILLGIPPAAALAATLLIDLQSLVSHFNVNIRAGFLNYIFIGTETHRYHHSADMKEAGNYGNTLAIWDIVFGTFQYQPGRIPEKLGMSEPGNYPPSDKLWEVISFPFRKTTGKKSV